MSRADRTALPLAERTAALGRAADLLEGIASDKSLGRAREVVERVGGRSALSAEHTVVGFFGATGSGKSSLVNAVVGQDVTRAAVRRPTTSKPVAAIVGEVGSEGLLDWLEVPERHVLDGTGAPLEQAVIAAASPKRGILRRQAAPEGPLPGMILLDLPDMDSVEFANRGVVERMTGLVDVIVWVTDPQKYADDVLHRQFVTPFAAHDATTVVVLNQLDRIREADRAGVLASLERLVRLDGLDSAPVLAVSAETKEGVDALRDRLAAIVAGREASVQRLRAEHGPMPAGVLLTAPWTDLTLSDPQVTEAAERDELLDIAGIRRAAARYAGGYALGDPRISPRFGTVEGLPPTLIVTGSDDMLAADARALAADLRAAAVPVVLVDQDGGQHDYPIMTEDPAAQSALRRQVVFVREACGMRD